ncbi:hypothetical protein [Hyalangium rubrum]|uniref:Uncharacterized protein n=1 Tax=Hyalangium rubrum TaxID=3103134 RepID=A0ABU5GWK0_9BACT|nr:hypothetical protein [Hyalangium sp. s54d21]MDY7224937.1 hypothetical protein [Hyalangium sp. s54d21]
MRPRLGGALHSETRIPIKEGRGTEDFLPRQGMPKAQDRALLERFAEKQGLTVEFIRLIPMLRASYVELVPH